MKVSKPVIIALVLSVLVSAYLFFSTGSKKTPTKTPQPAASALQQATTPQQTGVLLQTAKRLSGKIEPGWGRDPFIMPVTVRQEDTSMTIMPKLVAILDGKYGRVAIIGNDIVQKGDVIGGATVLEIKKDKVILARGGTRRIMTLEEAAKRGMMDKTGTKEKQ